MPDEYDLWCSISRNQAYFLLTCQKNHHHRPLRKKTAVFLAFRTLRSRCQKRNLISLSQISVRSPQRWLICELFTYILPGAYLRCCSVRQMRVSWLDRARIALLVRWERNKVDWGTSPRFWEFQKFCISTSLRIDRNHPPPSSILPEKWFFMLKETRSGLRWSDLFVRNRGVK